MTVRIIMKSSMHTPHTVYIIVLGKYDKVSVVNDVVDTETVIG